MKIDFKENVGLVHMQAMQGLKMAANASCHLYEYQDFFQEASLAFLLAEEKFDETRGFRFSTYFTMVAQNQFKKMIGQATGVKSVNEKEKQAIDDVTAENKRRAAAAEKQLPSISMGLRPVLFSEVRKTFEGQDDFEQRIPSNVPTPEEQLEFAQSYQLAYAKLSGLSKTFVDWLQEPPPELLREVTGQMAHFDLCSDKGVARMPRGLRSGLSIDSIAKFMIKIGVPLEKADIARVKRELEAMAEEVTA